MNRIITFLLLISSQFSSGQYFPASIEYERQLDSSLSHGLLATLKENRLISFSVNKQTAYIDFYDSDSLNLLAHEPIVFPDNDAFKLEIQRFVILKDQLMLIAVGRSKTNNQFGMFLYPVLENGKIGSVSKKTLLDYPLTRKSTIRTYLKTDVDQSFLLMGLIVQENPEKEMHQIFVYNKNDSIVFQKKFEIVKESASGFRTEGFFVFGKYYLYELWNEERYNPSLEKFQTTLEIRKYDLENFEIARKQKLRPEEGFLLRNFFMQENGIEFQLAASCLATSGKTITGTKGIYAAGLNEDWSVAYTHIHPFSKEVIAGAWNEDNHSDVPLIYQLKSVCTEGVGDVYYFYERTVETVKGKTIEYNYGPIIAIKIDYDGNLAWNRFIEKSQIAKGNKVAGPLVFPKFQLSEGFAHYLSKNPALYLSFQPQMTSYNDYLVYNDNPENEGLTAGQKRKAMTDLSKSVPFVIQFTYEEWEVEYELLDGMKSESGTQRIKNPLPKSNGYEFFMIRDSEGKEVLQRINYY